MKHIICYSGGEGSAICAVEVSRKYGAENTILLNHDISPKVEDEDIKRFKKEVAKYIGLNITYANMEGWETKDQFDVCIEKGGFQFQAGKAICTYIMKTLPFYNYLKENFPTQKGELREDLVIYYGFDKNEENRITRRKQLLFADGYKTDFPLTWGKRTITKISDIGIKKPSSYDIHKHANCKCCIKAGKQSWYLNYCLYPELFEKAKQSELIIGHSIIKGVFLHELEPMFKEMKDLDVKATEKVSHYNFWKTAKRRLKEDPNQIKLPCDCGF